MCVTCWGDDELSDSNCNFAQVLFVHRMVLRLLLPLCRSSVLAREASKNYYITVTHRLRLAYRHLAQLMVKEGRIPEAELLFYFTHYELGVLLQTRDPVLINK